MKKFIIGIGIATMVMGMASMASAAFDPNWVINFKCSTDSAGTAGAFTSIFKTKTNSPVWVDGVGTEDSQLPPGTDGVAYATSSIGGVGYVTDARPSFAGVTETWKITLNTIGLTGVNTIYVNAWNPKDTAPAAINNDFSAVGGETLKLYSVASFGGARTLLWTVDPAINGTGTGAGTFSGSFTNGSMFELEVASTVPEPGSMVAMLSGLAGLVGFGVRRRK